MGPRQCGLRLWCWLVPTVVWLVLVERQLDLSSVAARLRVTCEAHLYSLQVKESRRFPYHLPVQSYDAAVLGRCLQQCRFSYVVPKDMCVISLARLQLVRGRRSQRIDRSDRGLVVVEANVWPLVCVTGVLRRLWGFVG
ncbi:hypothetical protein Taro_039496 [Colocasia esculenta]|uniref:Secreted protein n=1 Tax=Colocasia esculenta TaxID=4460 RepID=A0A843WAT7_COLES|nr:hypothetical protein [Colocasia esculenta]